METLVLEMKKAGVCVIVLTLSPKGDFQDYLIEHGVEVIIYHIPKRWGPLYYLRHGLFLIDTIRKKNIDVLWSHLHPCNFIAVFAQYLVSSKVIIFRHHFHASMKHNGCTSLNKNEIIFEKIICKLAKRIVVPSNEVYNGMIIYENVPSSKLSIVHYIYDFNRYGRPNVDNVDLIRKTYTSKMIVLIAMRMIKLKRHQPALKALNRLIKENDDIQVILLDDGEEKNNILAYIKDEGLEHRIHYLGFVKNIIDYIGASDVIIHPSGTEASSSFIKEAGYCRKLVIVCDGVGDFSDYVQNDYNGYLLYENESLEDQIYNATKKIYENSTMANLYGSRLHDDVIRIFGVNDMTLSQYLALT